jgi:hypothetical protein
VDTETAPRVVIVNTSDRGGGAETVAWKLFKGYQRRGMKARMWVGQRTTDDPDVLHSFHQLRSPPDSSFSGFKRRLIKTAGARLGWEDFEFPTTRRLRDECGTTTDLIHCHNLHGGYFDLRELAALSLQIPVFVTLGAARSCGAGAAVSQGQSSLGANPRLRQLDRSKRACL